MKCYMEVLQPMVDAMAGSSPFQGVLYAGLMVVNRTPYVLEFNARMGDPETQVVLPLLKTDFLDVIESVIEHRLDQLPIEWHPDATVCVVMASGGYPGSYHQGLPLDWTPTSNRFIEFLDGLSRGNRAKRERDRDSRRPRPRRARSWKTLSEAQRGGLRVVTMISFEGCHFRTDIAHRALKA